MGLSKDLIQQFVEVTNDLQNQNEESFVLGTVHNEGGNYYVKIDGSDSYTPVYSTTKMNEGDRVTVMIKNHTATVTGNITSPSLDGTAVDGKIGAFSDIVTESITAVNGTIDNLVSENVTIKNKLTANEAEIETLKAYDVTVEGKLTAMEADIERIEAGEIDVETLKATFATIENLNATNANVNNLQANFGSFQDLTTEQLTAINAEIDNLSAVELTALNAAVENLKANKANISDLNAANAEITNLKSTKADVEVLEAEIAGIDLLLADKANVIDLNATNANVANLQANKANVSDLNAVVADIKKLDADKADITDLTADNISFTTASGGTLNVQTLLSQFTSGQNAQYLNITGSNATIANAVIKDAMIDSVSVNKLTSGTINTNEINIASDDNSMKIEDGTIQFADEDGNVRLQLGEDASGDFSFILKGEDGTTTLIDGSGIKEGAIADKLIKTGMINDKAITSDKINYQSFVSGLNADGTANLIKSSKIELDGTGQTLNVAFQEVESSIEGIENSVSGFDNRITTNTTNINAANGRIDTLISQNEVTNQKLNTIDGNITTINNNYSTLNQTVGGINATVASHTTQITETNTKIDNIQVGGRNMVLASNTEHTATFSEFGKSENTVIAFSDDVYNNVRKYTDTYITISMDIRTENVVNGSTNAWVGVQYSTRNGDKAVQWIGGSMVPKYPPTTNGFVRYSNTAYVTGKSLNVDTIYPPSVILRDFTGTITIKNIKIEVGNKPTDWSPAPEDVDNAIQTVDTKTTTNKSSIDLLNNQISLKVEQSQVNTTVNNAVNSITIGGRNLILKSDTSFNKTYTEFNKAEGIELTTSTYFAEKLRDLHGKKITISCDILTENLTKGSTNPYIGFELTPRKNDANSTPVQYIGLNHFEENWSPNSNGFIRVSRTMTLNTTDASRVWGPWIVLRDYTGTVTVKNFKAEIGSKPTEWSPAPEDVDSAIQTVDTKATTNKSSIDVLQGQIALKVEQSHINTAKTELQNDYNQKITNVQTQATNNKSSIDLLNNQISLKVEQSQVDSTVNNAVNNIQIGGRNLVLNTRDTKIGNINAVPDSNSRAEYAYYNIGTVLDQYPVDTQLTLSFDVNCVKDAFLQIYNTNMIGPNTLAADGVNIKKGMQRVFITYKLQKRTNAPQTNSYIEFYTYYGTNAFYEISKLKIELGNKPTEWTPAPEDVDNAIQTVDTKATTNKSSIDVLQGQIALKVEQSHINTAKTELQNDYNQKITNVQTQATNNKSSIDLLNNQIALKVEQSQVNTTVNNAINNIQIGGRNLFSICNINSPVDSPEKTGISIQDSTLTINGCWGTKLYLPEVAYPKFEPGKTYIAKAKVKILKNSYDYTLEADKYALTFYSWDVTMTGGDRDFFRISNPLDRNVGEEFWHEQTFVVPTTFDDTTHIIVYSGRWKDSNNKTHSGAWQITDFKIEEGNKATSWTPAPEDVEASISAKANSSDVYTKTEVYTKDETDSQINITKDSINLAVSNTYATKTSVDTKIGEIEVGARNLFAKCDISALVDGPETTGISLQGNTLTINGTWGATLYDGSKVYPKFQPGETYIARGKVKILRNTSQYPLSSARYGFKFHSREFSMQGGDAYFFEIPNATNINVGEEFWYEHKFVVPNNIDSSTAIIAYSGRWVDSNNNKNIELGAWQITDFKIEKGNKATDWTPAPEDVDLAITTVDTKVNTNSSSIDLLNTQIALKVEQSHINTAKTELQNDYNQKITNVQTQATNNKSSIDLLNNQIALKVEQSHINTAKTELQNDYNQKITNVQTQATNNKSSIDLLNNQISLKVEQSQVDTTVNNAVNNIQVGGRNLVIDSKTFTASNGNNSEGTIEPDGSLKIVTHDSSNYHSGFFSSSFSRDHIENSFEEGDNFTISFWIKSPDTIYPPRYYMKPGMGYYDLTGTVNPDTYSQVYYTGVWKKADTINPHLGFHSSDQKNKTYYISAWKIEKGSKPTDWSAAPEDIENAITTVDQRCASIELDVDSITSTVSNNSGNISTLTQTVNGINSTVSSNTGKISTLTNTVNGLNSTVSNHTGSISTLTNTVNGLNTTVSNNAGNISSLEQTANQIVADFGQVGANLILNGRPVGNSKYWEPTSGGGSTITALFSPDTYNSANWWGEYFRSGFRFRGNLVSGGWAGIRNDSIASFRFSRNKTFSISMIIYNYKGSQDLNVQISDPNSANYVCNKIITIASGYQHVSFTFTPSSSGNTPSLMLMQNSPGEFDYYIPWIVVREGNPTRTWIDSGEEINKGSTIINRDGVTIKNGAIRVEDASGNVMLDGDSDGKLYLRKELNVGTVGQISQSGVTVTDGNLTVVDAIDKSTYESKINSGELVLTYNALTAGGTPPLESKIGIKEGYNGLYIGCEDYGAYGSIKLDGKVEFTRPLEGQIKLNGLFTPLAGTCIHSAYGSSGSTGYVKIARIKILGSYCNDSVKFSIGQRGKSTITDFYFQFGNTESTDPALAAFTKTTGSANAYMVKNTTSTWDIYVQKTEGYDEIAVTDLQIPYRFHKAVVWTWTNEHVTSLPSGYTAATLAAVNIEKFYIKDNTSETLQQSGYNKMSFGVKHTDGDHGIALTTESNSHTLRPWGTDKNVMNLGTSGVPYKDVWLTGFSRANTGYTKLPNEMILQWGQATCNNGSNVTVTFPLKFPTAVYSVWGTGNYSGSRGWTMHFASMGLTGVTLYKTHYAGGTNSDTIFWVALGR